MFLNKVHYRLSLFIILILSALTSHAQITQIVSPYKFIAFVEDEKDLRPNKVYRLGVYHEEKLIGVARVDEVIKQTEGGFVIKASIVDNSRNLLFQEGNSVRTFDLANPETDYPARVDLLAHNTEIAHYKFRPLVTLGILTGETAATLADGESFLDMFLSYHYGLTDDLTISTLASSLAVKAPTVQLKYSFFEGNNYRWAFSGRGIYHWEEEAYGFQGAIHWDTYTNSKTIQHTNISFRIAQDNLSYEDLNGLFAETKIQTGSEIILDDWNRFIYGPSYNVDTESVGGFIGYIKIYNHLHIHMTLETKDVTNLELNTETGYIPSVYAYWRW